MRLFKSKNIPEIVAHIELIKEVLEESNPNEVLPPIDIKEMCKVANNPRDRILLQLFFEATSRVGELIRCNIQDFSKKTIMLCITFLKLYSFFYL